MQQQQQQQAYPSVFSSPPQEAQQEKSQETEEKAEESSAGDRCKQLLEQHEELLDDFGALRPSIAQSNGSIVGYLNKYANKGGFRRRWFRLTGETLLYFTSPRENVPRGFFWLDGATLQKHGRLAKRNRLHSVVTRGRSMGTPFALVLSRNVPGGQAWELDADTEVDFEGWLAALEAAGAQRIEDARVPTKEEEEDITAGLKQTLSNSVDTESMRKFKRAASRKLAISVTTKLAGGGLITEKAAAKAVDSVIDKVDKTLTLTDDVAKRLAVAVTLAQLPPDSPLRDAKKIKPDKLAFSVIKSFYDDKVGIEVAPASPTSPGSPTSAVSEEKKAGDEEEVDAMA